MTPQELASISAGFSDEARGSQSVFRAALEALSHPGRLISVMHDAPTPQHGHAASAAVLLALLDAECTLWLSPTLAASNAAAWLRFHTGCTLVDEMAKAQFAWVANPDELPPLGALAQGSDIYPDQSATCVIDMPHLSSALNAEDGWTWSGPGINGLAHVRVDGLPQGFTSAFAKAWQSNHAAFPCGVDLILASAQHIVGLPRTTRLAIPVEA
jgi:alpha-D-ribose 1-methylphosphonate 5-triphosphate synthase subunit PhnH